MGRCASEPRPTLWSPGAHLLTTANFPLYSLVYDTLVSYDQELNSQPRLAANWTWSTDYRELRLRLDPGVTFHRPPLTSFNVKFNLERLRDPSAGSQWLNYARLMQVVAPTPDSVVIGSMPPPAAPSTRSPLPRSPIPKR